MLARTVVSLILAPAVLGILFLAPPVVFVLLVFLVAQFTFIEYLRLVPVLRERNRQLWLMVLSGAVVLTFGFIGSSMAMMSAMLLTVFLAVAIEPLLTSSDMDRVLPTVAASTFGLIYIPLFLGLLIPIRYDARGSGLRWIFFLLLVTWASDIGGYLVGRSLGRRKLSPSISPGKTVEGSVAGLASSLSIGLIFFYFVDQSWHWPAMAGIFGVVGQCGDLFESILKRAAGVKDSSGRIPGHGGLLDRLDSLLFCCPVLFVTETLRW